MNESEVLRHMLEQVDSDKVQFAREKIDQLVHKEVQLKLNAMAQSEEAEVGSLRGQVEQARQEKQAYLLISNDIHGKLSYTA